MRINNYRFDYEGKFIPKDIELNYIHLGDFELLKRPKLAFFCSNKCPGNIILKIYDLAQELREKEITVISGFHTPVEKEVLRLLLRGKQPVIICPARSIENWRMPSEYKKPIDDGRLLILSPFDKKHRRITEETSQIRNELVASLADMIFVAYAAPGSKTALLVRELAGSNNVYSFDTVDDCHLKIMNRLLIIN
jgi:predicted Rossmann fold nucleotide-binding protein DprA/Smf involved in DNA uptake